MSKQEKQVIGKQVLKELENVKPGDLIAVDWFDASIGKSRATGGMVEVPVRSWGVYLGLMGVRTRQLVLAQNSFRYGLGVFDLDYTAIPLSWAIEVQCIQSEHLPKKVVGDLLESFASDSNRKSTGRLTSARIFQHKIQRRLSTCGRPN